MKISEAKQLQDFLGTTPEGTRLGHLVLDSIGVGKEMNDYKVMIQTKSGKVLWLDDSTTFIEAHLIKAQHGIPEQARIRSKSKHPRKKYTAEQKAEMVKKYRNSPLTHDAFCEKQKIGKSTMARWVRDSAGGKQKASKAKTPSQPAAS